MNICYTALVILITCSLSGMEKTPQEITLSSWPSHKDALSYLAMERELQNHLFHLGDTNLKIQFQKKILEALLLTLKDPHLNPHLGNNLSIDFLSVAHECMDVLETQLVTVGAQYLKDSESVYATNAQSLREKFYLLALFQKNLPLIDSNLLELELKIINFFCDESLPHMELLINPNMFDVTIDDNISMLKSMSAQYALPAIKKAYLEKCEWKENGMKAQEFLRTYQIGCDFYLVRDQRLIHHSWISEIIKKYDEYQKNIQDYIEKLKKVSYQKQDDYCEILREANKIVSKPIDQKTLQSKADDIRTFINSGLAIIDAELDTHPFIRDDFKALIKKAQRLHQTCLSELDDTNTPSNKQLPLCKIEITPIEKSALAEILKKNTVWGWRKLPKNCELGFADKAGNFVEDERIPYSSTLYFIADVSKKIKAAQACKQNSKKSLFATEGILFKGISDECDYAPLDENDGSPTKVLYSHGGSYYILQSNTHECAYAIDRILALTKNSTGVNADPTSVKIQNPTRDGK